MIATVIEWHNIAEELPEKSGEYLVYKHGHLIDVPYSSRHKKFNAYDEYDETPHAVEYEYWAEIPKITDDESEELQWQTLT